MSINSQDDDPGNEPYEDPVREDDLAERSPGTSPAADVFTGLMEYFSNGGDISPKNEIVKVCTRAYLDSIDPVHPPTPDEIEKHLLSIINGVCKTENMKTTVATEKLLLMRVLTHWQIAQILLRFHHVVRIAPTGMDTDREYDLLGMYVAEGRNRGVHTMSEDDIRTTARMYNLQLTLKEFTEVLSVLKEDSPRLQFCLHRDLVAVNNGVFHYGNADLDLEIDGTAFHFKAKTLHPFDPTLVFRA